jgi:hypothetical protein
MKGQWLSGSEVLSTKLGKKVEYVSFLGFVQLQQEGGAEARSVCAERIIFFLCYLRLPIQYSTQVRVRHRIAVVFKKNSISMHLGPLGTRPYVAPYL